MNHSKLQILRNMPSRATKLATAISISRKDVEGAAMIPKRDREDCGRVPSKL